MVASDKTNKREMQRYMSVLKILKQWYVENRTALAADSQAHLFWSMHLRHMLVCAPE